MNNKLALLGPRGTFSEEAAERFNPNLERLYCSSIEEVFEEVEKGRAKYGIVPVENSLEGSVSSTLENLLSMRAEICREIVLYINHTLLAGPGVSIQGLREVVSHPHALAQCRDFLRTIPGLKTRNFPSTAEAARWVAENNPNHTAAIAPRIAASLYHLQMLAEGIQDEEQNQTRFFVISKNCPQNEGRMKTSIIIGLKDKPGALYHVLGHFAKGGLNLTKIESRPTKKSLGDYLFYIDFLGSSEDEDVKDILHRLEAETTMLKLLGSYISEG